MNVICIDRRKDFKKLNEKMNNIYIKP